MKQVIGLISICLFCSTILPAQLSLSIESKTAKVGEEFCVDVTVSDFQDVLSFQAQFIQDDSLLTFTRFENLNFPPPLWGDGYAHDARIAWVSSDLINGATMDGKHSLVSLCYTARKSGISTISIFNDSTDLKWLDFLPLEVYDANENLIDLAIEEGLIIIEEDNPQPLEDTETRSDSLTTSLPSNPLVDLYTFSPSPVHTKLTIASPTEAKKSIRIYTANGQLLYDLEKEGKEIMIDTQQLARGMYLVTIQEGASIISKRLIKL